MERNCRLESPSYSKDNEVDRALPMINSPDKHAVGDDFSPASAGLSFHMILAKSNIRPVYHMFFPAKLCRDLPSATIPAVIDFRGKTWEAIFVGDCGRKKLNNWKTIVIENELKLGDAFFWEVIESGNERIKFKVQVVKGDFPTELEPKVNGKTENTPIILD